MLKYLIKYPIKYLITLVCQLKLAVFFQDSVLVRDSGNPRQAVCKSRTAWFRTKKKEKEIRLSRLKTVFSYLCSYLYMIYKLIIERFKSNY